MMTLMTAFFAVLFFTGFFVLVAVMVGLLWMLDRFVIGVPQNPAAEGETSNARAELPDLIWDTAIWL